MSLLTYGELIPIATQLITEAGVNADACTVKVTDDEQHVIVEFYPKKLVQFGGGGRVVFIKDELRLRLVKVERWQ